MRIIVMFDLPTLTAKDLREYRYFRNFLIKNGFIMMQESVYTKLVLNGTVAEAVKKSVRNAVPKDGLVQMLTVTEKQFQGTEMLIGSEQTAVCDSTDRLIVL